MRIRYVSALVVFAAFFAPFLAFAQECTEMRHQWAYGSGAARQWFDDASAAHDFAAQRAIAGNASCGDGNVADGYTLGSLSAFYSGSNPGSGQWRGSFTLTCSSNGVELDRSYTGARQYVELPCPEPPNCAGYDGPSQYGFYRTAPAASLPAEMCHSGSNCVATRTSMQCSGGDCMASYSISSRIECESGAPSEDEDLNKGDGETCVGPFCTSEPGTKSCGFYNDSYVCLDRTPDDGCQVLSGGGRVCADGAPTPPVPDSGTPGVPATPDDQIQTVNNEGDTITYNFYGGGTVSGSARDPGETGENPAGSDDEGEGVEDGLHCDPDTDAGCSEEGENGAGDDPRAGWQCWADGAGLSAAVAGCFEAAGQGLWSALVSQSSLLQVASDTAAAFPSGGGACPSGEVTIDWVDSTFDFWEVPCQFFDEVESILGPLFLLMWSVVGLRILLTIPGGE